MKLFSVSENSALLQANLFLITSSTGVLLTNIYFVSEHMFITILSTVYNYTIGILFGLTLKDFSYVIFSLNTSTI